MRKLSLENAVSLSQVVSAFVLVFTLLYAVSEWVRTRATTNTELEWILYERMLEMDVLVAESEELADIVLRAGSDPRSLTPSERARYLAYEDIFYNTWNAAYDAWESGLIGTRQYELWERFFTADAARRPKFAWTENLRYFNPPFIQYVESRVDWQ